MAQRPIHKIEAKWQDRWEKEGVYQAKAADHAPKFYGLVEFPYPSGEGLHVGHPRSYTAIDVLTRKQRMDGKNVLYPIGWDAFGLPTENFAIKHKMAPQEATKKNIANFTRQLQSIGFGFDWSREINTTDPSYYKWTQWQFIRFFNSYFDETEQCARPIGELLIPREVIANGEKAVRGYRDARRMAYKASSTINWCPRCKIGLANEEAQGGVCERCGNPVEKREKAQWMIRITKYADRLLKDLGSVDYLEKIKAQQVNWIGKSEGAHVDFAIHGTKNTKDKVTVFTTRPDTLFGATYLVLAPEHPFVGTWLEEGNIKNAEAVRDYQMDTAKKSDIERQAEGKKKTGAVLEGLQAVNPANGKAIPVWISDYVLASYGTGAIMAVPGHDARDFDFATTFELPIEYVVAPVLVDENSAHQEDKKTVTRQTVHAVVRNPKTGELLAMKWKKYGWVTFVVGGIDEGEDVITAARREVQEETGYKDLNVVRVLGGPIRAEYYAPHKDENRIAYVTAVLFDLASDARDEVDAEESAKHEPEWISEAELEKPGALLVEHAHWLARLKDESSNVFTGEGEAIHSGFLDTLPTWKAKDDMISWLEEEGNGTRATTYKLRDWVFSRQRYWGEPIPIILCDHCGFVPVPDEALPLQLPDVEAYEPTDSGESPLANMTDWVEVNCPSCGGKAKRETDTMPNWAGSSWYFLRYCDPHNNDALADPEKLKYWMPVDLYNGGMEHTTLHLLYSRFWYKFLWDLGIVPEACGNEPYARRRSHGLILAEGGEKMSKSKGNVVNPDDVVQEYGADVFRMYEMFMGPFDQPVPWDTNGIEGVKRFLDRVWFIYNPEEAMTLGDSRFGKEVFEGTKEQDPAFPEVLFHQTIKKISLGIDQMQFNTCVSQLMLLSRELVGPLEKFSLEYKEIFLQLLAPFAPHITEELWFQMGKTESIHLSGWPKYDESKLQAATFELVVQVNGKVRAKFEVSSDISEEDAKARALASEQVKTYLAGKVPKKVIYVLGKLVSIVV